MRFSRWQVTPMLPTKFRVSWPWPFGSGEEAKNRFSRWRPWRPSWISDRNNLSYFDLQVTPMLPTKFRVNWPFGSGEEAKIDFQDGCHLRFRIGIILAIFDLKVTLMFPTKFRGHLVFWFRRRSEK